MQKEEGKKDNGLAVPEQRQGKQMWQPMLLTPVGSLDAIRNNVGSLSDSGGGMMMGFGT
jgi:hypothetical protein